MYDIDLSEVHAELGRRDFEYFVRLMRPQYQLVWYHERICAAIQAWEESPKPYHLILSMPPGHAKSEYAKLAMAWISTRDRTMQSIYASYGQDLADQQLHDVQAILDSDEYLTYYDPALNDKRAVSDASRGAKRTGNYAELLGGGGWIKSVGRGGGLTGFRVDRGFVDDLLKDDIEARSGTTRDAAWSWITRVLMTRKRPQRPLRLLVIATRWHLDDPTGRLLAAMPDRCVELRFEALRTDMSDPDDPREEGEALWPAVATQETLEEMRELDPYGFMALYQQRPVPASGTLFDPTWLRRHDAVPACPGRWIQSWDCRHGGKGANTSYAVGQLWFIPDHEQVAYLADQVRGRWSPEETLEVFDRLQGDAMWKRSTARLIEEKADGVMLLSLRGRTYPGMVPIKPTADKEARARLVQPILRAGQVMIPARAAWLADWLDEVLNFPGAAHDDQVDAMTQLLSYAFTPSHRDPREAARATWSALLS